jgi:hypothetical protein
VIQSAAAYQAYMTRATAIQTDFKTGEDVADRLKTGESYDPSVLVRGEIAYAAVVALQDPAFVAEVRGFAVDPAGRQQMTNTIASDPNYVTAFKSSAETAALVRGALLAEGHGLQAEGEAVRLSAYDLQHQAWSKEMVAGRDERLALAKTLSANTPVASLDEAEHMRQAATGAAPMSLPPADAPPPPAPALLSPTPASPPVASAPVSQALAAQAAAPAPIVAGVVTAAAQPTTAAYPPAVVRGMAIAALALLGNAGDENAALIAPLFADPPDQTCLAMAKLNLYQCLAVAKPHYEDVFCLGQHAMEDTGQCVRFAAGAPVPVVAATPVSKTEVSYAPKPKPAKKKRKKGG